MKSLGHSVILREREGLLADDDLNVWLLRLPISRVGAVNTDSDGAIGYWYIRSVVLTSVDNKHS
jgi:hypothetical protein